MDLAMKFGCVFLVLALVAGINILFGWLTMLTFHGFGFTQVQFWPCVGAWVLISALFNAARSTGKSD